VQTRGWNVTSTNKDICVCVCVCARAHSHACLCVYKQTFEESSSFRIWGVEVKHVHVVVVLGCNACT
jgi:hypothetical protein